MFRFYLLILALQRKIDSLETVNGEREKAVEKLLDALISEIYNGSYDVFLDALKQKGTGLIFQLEIIQNI